MKPPEKPYLNLGLEPVARDAVAGVLATGSRPDRILYPHFNIEDYIRVEVQNALREVLPQLMADHLTTALGNSPVDQKDLTLETARMRDRVIEATRRGRTLYAHEKLRPSLLYLAHGLKVYLAHLARDTTEYNAARAWDKLWKSSGPLRYLRDLEESHPDRGTIEASGALPAMKRGSLISLSERSLEVFAKTERDLRSLALGPAPVEPGRAVQMADQLVNTWSCFISHMRGLARALDKAGEGSRHDFGNKNPASVASAPVHSKAS